LVAISLKEIRVLTELSSNKTHSALASSEEVNQSFVGLRLAENSNMEWHLQMVFSAHLLHKEKLTQFSFELAILA